jgi:hypothetical protein
MSVLIFVSSWLISIGFKFWMIEAAFAPIGQAEICSFIVPSFFLKPPTGRLPFSRLTCLPHPIAQFPIRRVRDKEVWIRISLLEFWG